MSGFLWYSMVPNQWRIRLILRFEGHTDWSQEETELKIQKLTGFLDRNRITYNKEIGEYGSFQIEITRPDFVGFLSFIKEQLHAPASCLHFPYQTLCVNGEGKFELIYYFPNGMDIDRFAQSIWNRKFMFPKVEPFGTKNARIRKKAGFATYALGACPLCFFYAEADHSIEPWNDSDYEKNRY